MKIKKERERSRYNREAGRLDEYKRRVRKMEGASNGTREKKRKRERE